MINNFAVPAPGPLARLARRIGLAAAAVAVLAMTACSDNNTSGQDPMAGHTMSPNATPSSPAGPSPSPSAGSQSNSADVEFAAMMIPHHEQAVVMSDLILPKKDLDPDVRAMADQIKAAQQPEINTMKRWLEEWGTPPDHTQMDHGESDSGMMTPEQLREMRDADPGKAQRMFLEGMIKHHQGAITMAESEIADGQNPDAIAMAHAIITAQREEIDTMETLLKQL